MFLDLYIGVILFGGLACLVRVIYTTFRRGAGGFAGVPSWNGSWTDFGILVWALIMCVWLFSGLGFWLVDALQPEGGADDAVMMGISAVLTSLALFTAAASTRVFTGHFLGGRLNSTRWSVQQALPFALYLLLAALPLVLVVNAGWSQLLVWVSELGYDVDLSDQPIVESIVQAESPWSPLVVFFAAVFLAPVGEELVFRGGIYRFLKGRWGVIIAGTASAVLFALIHEHMATFMPLFLLGLVLVFAYERSGNIFIPIAFHSMFNLNSIAVLLFLEHYDGVLP